MDSSRASGPDPSTSSEIVAVDPLGKGVNKEKKEIIGAESPKVVEWEELQKELARLWSLSSALAEAKERKDSLSRRIQEFVELREESLGQSNELEDMRGKLDAQKFAIGDMSMCTKEILQDIKCQRERICIATRVLLNAAQNLSTIRQQLQEANKLLAGKRGHGNLRNLQKMLRMSQQYIISQVSTLYRVKASNESKEKLDLHDGDSEVASTQNTSNLQQAASLTILGLQLTALPLEEKSIFSNKSEVQRSAVVLGYVTHDLEQLLNYIGAESLGPRHVLANLKELMTIIRSPHYIHK